MVVHDKSELHIGDRVRLSNGRTAVLVAGSEYPNRVTVALDGKMVEVYVGEHGQLHITEFLDYVPQIEDAGIDFLCHIPLRAA